MRRASKLDKLRYHVERYFLCILVILFAIASSVMIVSGTMMVIGFLKGGAL